ncbi:MAG: hypothetical protein K1060chlam2_00551 [Chlamydiae bacterium]|nr:hypothetical protein [Chlamydiota bacterium]
MKKIEIEFYINANGKSPYIKWINSLTITVRAMILRRITRLEAGNFGDAKLIKSSRDFKS